MAKFEFVFDDWMRLASTDPEAFEKAREQTIRHTIADAPANYRTRLLRLQWRVDMERKRHNNPMSACVTISRMMLDSVFGEHGMAKALNFEAQTVPAKQAASCAKVLDLSKYR